MVVLQHCTVVQITTEVLVDPTKNGLRLGQAARYVSTVDSTASELSTLYIGCISVSLILCKCYIKGQLEGQGRPESTAPGRAEAFIIL